MTRTTEAGLLTCIANHPDVRPWLGGAGPVDFGPLVSDPRNVTLMTECGGFIGYGMGDGVFEVHAVFLRRPRSVVVLPLARQAIAYMFSETPATALIAHVPLRNRAVRRLAVSLGFTVTGYAPIQWTADTTVPGVRIRLMYDDWRRTADIRSSDGKEMSCHQQ